MKRIELDKLFTEKVTEYLQKGYHIHTPTFGGSDGTLRVDLIKENDFIRVYLDRTYKNGECIIELVVGHKALTKHELYSEIIWKDTLKKIYSETFYEIKVYEWYVSQSEYEEIRKIRKERRENRECYSLITPFKNQKRAKKIVLPFLRRMYRCKSMQLSEINRVYKENINLNNRKQVVRIVARNRVYTLT